MSTLDAESPRSCSSGGFPLCRFIPLVFHSVVGFITRLYVGINTLSENIDNVNKNAL